MPPPSVPSISGKISGEKIYGRFTTKVLGGIQGRIICWHFDSSPSGPPDAPPSVPPISGDISGEKNCGRFTTKTQNEESENNAISDVVCNNTDGNIELKHKFKLPKKNIQWSLRLEERPTGALTATIWIEHLSELFVGVSSITFLRGLEGNYLWKFVTGKHDF